MGKGEDEHNLPGTAFDAQGTTPGAGNSNGCCVGCSKFRKLVSLRCLFALVLGFAVLLSAVFWLPFLKFGDHRDLDLDYRGHNVVASFMLRKPASFLQEHILQLQGDIFDEMSLASTKVEIISLETSATPNVTKVLFAVESDVTTRSLIRELFVSLITRQSVLHLTNSLFGDPFEFNVLKFRGGITVSPEQKAFLMQNVQILFNFTLNYSIDEILVNFEELRSQLDRGLHLSSNENLYIRLTNLKGSTVAPPTTVMSQVLLAVGIPSNSRLKQLAQTITGSHAKNLGLNNTVFGRVKQVSLSSILQHSLGGSGSSPAPSPSPLPPSHHHHHHHHHRQHHEPSLPPDISPTPPIGHHGSVIGRQSPTSAPVPAPSPCQVGRHNTWKHSRHHRLAPSASPGPAPSQPKEKYSPPPKRAPFHGVSPPNVGHGHSHPPSTGESNAGPSSVMSMVSSPSPSPSSSGILSSNTLPLLLFILAVLLL